MRLLGLFVGSVCAAAFGLPAAAAEEPSYPYTAYVSNDDTYIRSGPGKNYYPTDKLARGDTVEVYRHDPGGWYAIRPPRGSFSWVPARLLQPTKDGLAIVTGDRVVSRVGSRFSDVRDVIQVRLDRGEEVEIIDMKTVQSHGGQTEQWCKIAPPSGEFRWVFGHFVDRNPPNLASVDRHDRAVTRASDSRESRAGNRDSEDRADRRYYVADLDARGEPDDDDRTAHPIDRRGDRHTMHRTSTEGDSAPAAGTTSDSLHDELDSIDMALSAMVIEEPTVWKFDDLDRRAQAALNHAKTAVERGKAHLMLDKLARFEDIQRRAVTIGNIQTDTDRKNFQAGAAVDAHPPAGLAAVEAPARFDAKGKLAKVESHRPNAPPYALLNGDGEVVAFVSAAPGVNLSALVGRQIGVSGQRGFMPEFKKPYITALRFEPLDNGEAIASRDATRR